ncbi:response regulator transcription factor [Ktedonosporobacter rubrisoli]|uniref:Response regulator transcription factor n=2 Tax=Ktedonosporobacter rubrisoli TaxID=2509675 RepID=A0A4P6K5X5_KTERU|nr:response regulator transcription factor [Ktedonosporobacter rubrisoli]
MKNRALRSYARNILRAFVLADRKHDNSNEARNSLLFEPLSLQELRVLHLLEEGYTNPQIANELVISVNTVKDHVKHLYRKLGVNNRYEAGEVARQLKLS